MRSFALSESVLSSHFHRRPPRTFPSHCLSSAASPPSSDKQISRLSYRDSTSVSWRYRTEWFNSAFKDRFISRFIPAPSGDDPQCQHFPRIQEVHLTDWPSVDERVLEKKTSEIKSITALESLTSPNASPFNDLLKFSAVFGLLALQGSEPALASPDIASGLQSLPFLGDLGDISTGFASAFLLIFFSELGDKTFFIAALLAARNSAAIVFAGTFGALAAMTVVSVALGRTFHYVDEILPFKFGETDLPVDDIAAVCLLVYFGVSTLLDATSNDSPKSEDEQKEAELAVSKFTGNGAGILAAASTVFSTFVLVFVAEWGDKSFFSTIALAAASSPLGVIGGALAGHGVATLLAVLGGSLLGTFLSEKAISYIGGVLFLVFAALTLIEIVS